MAAFDEKEYTKSFDWSIWKRLMPILARFKGRYIKIGRASCRESV